MEDKNLAAEVVATTTGAICLEVAQNSFIVHLHQ